MSFEAKALVLFMFVVICGLMFVIDILQKDAKRRRN